MARPVVGDKRADIKSATVAEAYYRLVPNSELVVVEDAGNSPQLEKPEEIGALISSFLNVSPARARQ